MGIDIAKERREQAKNQETAAFKIDCHACKLEGGMKKANIKRFTGMVYFVGEIIVIPSSIGIICAFFIAFWGGGPSLMYRLGIAFAILFASCISGCFGWVLISKRSVLLCKRCGFVLDRAP